MKRKNEYVDPFEAFVAERDASTRRLMRDKVTVVREAAASSGSTPETLAGKEKLKLKKAIVYKHQNQGGGSGQHGQEAGASKALTSDGKTPMSSIRLNIMALHNSADSRNYSLSPISAVQPDRRVNPNLSTSKNPPNPVRVQNIGSLIKRAEFFKSTHERGWQTRFNSLVESLILCLLSSPDLVIIKFQLYSNVRKLIDWFINFRYEFVALHENLSELREECEHKLAAPIKKPRLETSLKILLEQASRKNNNPKNSLISTVVNQRYVPKDLRRDKKESHPTHVVEGVKTVGVYMVAAEVRDIETKECNTVLLLKPGKGKTIAIGDLVKLPENSKKTQAIDGRDVPVYLTFQLYREAL